MTDQKIIYTHTDEAPLLATYSFLPIVQAYASAAGVAVDTRDISVAARILAQFGLADDSLTELGELAKTPAANIIKLPNISASIPQLKAAIKELQGKGYKVPDYPEDPKSDEDKAIRARYAKCIGSAVNPVLREGNSDRRAPRAVKEYARKNPHSMAEWAQASRTHVSHMHAGDFYHGEKSMTLDRARDVKMELVTKSGKTLVLRPSVKLVEGEIIDSMYMSKQALCAFFEKELARKTEQFGNVAHAFSTYASYRTASDSVPFSRGINSIQLLKDADRYWIVNVFWEYELDRRIVEEEGWQDLATKGFDPPRRFAAFLHTLRWNCVTATDPNLFKYPVAFMHGRNSFQFNKQEREQLKEYITRGGVLFGDAACGAKPWSCCRTWSAAAACLRCSLMETPR